jgi:hypothetical protein
MKHEQFKSLILQQKEKNVKISKIVAELLNKQPQLRKGTKSTSRNTTGGNPLATATGAPTISMLGPNRPSPGVLNSSNKI